MEYHEDIPTTGIIINNISYDFNNFSDEVNYISYTINILSDNNHKDNDEHNNISDHINKDNNDKNILLFIIVIIFIKIEKI